MTHNQQKYVCALLFGGATLTCTITAQADFLADSKGELEARNFYFNRDFRQQGARDRAEEWAQGVWCARWQKGNRKRLRLAVVCIDQWRQPL
jgi:hypothetical protein